MVQTATARRDLRLMRLYYFATIGASGFLFPFLTLYYRRQGLSGAQIGLIGAMQASVGLVAAPVWGRWSDRVRQPRRLLQFALMGTAVVSLALGRQQLFIPIALLVSLDALIMAGWTPVSDSMAVTLAEQVPGAGFGSVRLWGSLGWTLVTAAAGWLIERLTIYVAFVSYALGVLGGAITLFFIPPSPRETAVAERTDAENAIGTGQIVRALLRNRRLTGLATALALSWLLSGSIYGFEAIYMDELGAGETLIGVANALNAAVELPAMLWVDRLLHRFSAGRLLRAAFVMQAVRMGTVLLAPTIGTLLLMRLLIGLQFSFFSVALIAYINMHSPRALRVTTLALLTVTLRNLIAMVGNPLSGLVYDAAGAYWLYALGLVGAVLGWVALWQSRDNDHKSRTIEDNQL